MLDVIKLSPHCTDYIWGGTKFLNWGKKSSLSRIAECWEVSLHEAGSSIIASGKYDGKKLKDVLTSLDIGNKANQFPFFPILVKLIDAKDNLSIQVHPSDEYALKYENSFGKTEMWYVLENEPGAVLYVGFNKDTSKEEVEERIKNNTIIEILNKIEVKPGECYFIPSGTIHAIGKGVTVLEVQQNSNLTYRVYDYGRVGTDGKPRELHIEKALKVLNYHRYDVKPTTDSLLARCSYFTSYLSSKKEIIADNNSFKTFTVISGEGSVNGIAAKKGDSFFIPANKKATLEGNLKYVLTYID